MGNKSKQAKSVKVGCKVITRRNRFVQEQEIVKAEPSAKTDGVRLVMESGKSLVVTRDQKLWATHLQIPDDEAIIYLMYRPDLGFRIGKTNYAYVSAEKIKNKAQTTPSYGGRPQQERAERFWIIARAKDNEEALYLEELFSLYYGIPTAVFMAESRGVNQDRVDAIFELFGNRGFTLLADKEYSFEHPHWMAYNSEISTTITMLAHGNKHSFVGLEWKDHSLDAAVSANGIKYTSSPGYPSNRIRWYSAAYKPLLERAMFLTKVVGGCLRNRMYHPMCALEPLLLLPASSLFENQSITTIEGNGTLGLDRIIDIVPVSGQQFVSLDTVDTGNIVANGLMIAT